MYFDNRGHINDDVRYFPDLGRCQCMHRNRHQKKTYIANFITFIFY
jgi:hypothetical protein